jgi:CBS domain-containing protein
MPVLSNEENKVIGIITISDLVTLYDKEVEKITKIMNRSNINTKNDEMNNQFRKKPVDSKK